MSSKKLFGRRFAGLTLAAALLASTITGCGGAASSSTPATSSKTTSSAAESVKTDSSKADSSAGTDSSKADSSAADSSVEEQPEDTPSVPSVLMDADVAYVNVPDADKEFAQEFTFTAEGAKISGTVAEEDITLGETFANMKVSNISNDENTVKLTVSGSAAFDEDATKPAAYGTVKFAGKLLGVDEDVTESIQVTQLVDEEPVVGGWFYPFFDAVIEQDDAYELTILLMPKCAEFAEGFSKESITLSEDFEDASIVSLEAVEDDDDYELVLSVPKPEEETEEGYVYIGGITIAPGSLVDREGRTNAEERKMCRSYSAASLGRDLNQKDIHEIKEIVGGFGNTTWGTVAGIASGIGTGASVGWTVLGFCGVVPNDSSRHAQIMEALAQLQQSINQIHTKLDEMNNTLERQTDLLYAIQKTQYEESLAPFNAVLKNLTSLCNEVESSLNKANYKKLNTVVDSYEKIQVDTGDMEEADEVIRRMGAKIANLPFSNTMTMAQKINAIEEDFRTIANRMVDDATNPVRRYRELLKVSCNFSTSGIEEEELFEETIRATLFRAMNIMVSVNGYASTEELRKMYADCVYPDVHAGTTDSQGNPFCYLMEAYVRIGDPTQIYRDLKGQEKGDKKFLSDADVVRFIERMQGRTLREELVKAGFPDSQINGRTTFKDSEGIPWGNEGYYGVAFKFENWRPKGLRPWIGNHNQDIGDYWELNQFIKDNFAHGLSDYWDKLLDDHEKSSIVAGYGLHYGERNFSTNNDVQKGWSECLVNITGSFRGYESIPGSGFYKYNKYEKGLYVEYPLAYFEAVR